MSDAQENRKRMEEVLDEQKANQEIQSMVQKEHCRIMREKYEYLMQSGFDATQAMQIILAEVSKP